MARRRYQRGSLFLRGKKRVVWVGRWYEDEIQSDASTRRIYKKEVLGTKHDFPTRKLALRELESRVAAVNNPHYRGLRTDTFAQFAKWWQDNILADPKRFKPSTRSVIKSQLKTQLIPYFGEFTMKDISYQVIVAYIRHCPKSPKSCRNYMLTLKMMWKSAKAGSWVQHNPFEDLRLPGASPKNPSFYTPEEAKQIIQGAEGQFKTLFWLAAETGLRPGELCGLALDNLHLDKFQITVTQSVWGGEIQTPKNKNAVRVIAVSESLVDHLLTFLATWKPNPLNLIFASTTNGPLSLSSVRRDRLKPVCEKLGIVPKGLKAFRHCSATMMDQASVPMKVRQERLGHAPGSKVTMVHYTHAVTEDARSAASAIGNILVN